MKRVSRNIWWRVIVLLSMGGAHPSVAQSSAPPVAANAQQADASASAQGWMEQGREAYRQKRFQAASDAYAKAYQLDPSLLSALYNRAYALRKAGDFAGAEKLYREVLSRQPDDMDALFGWAETLRLLKRNPEAKSAFEAYVAKEKRNGKTKYIAYAREQILSVVEPQSIVDDTKAKLDKKRAKEELESAKQAYKKKEYVVAAEKYERAFQAAPQDPYALYRAALSWRKAGRFERSKMRYSEYLAREPQNLDAIYGLAETFRLMNDKAEALRYFARYVEMEKRPSEQKFVERAEMWVAKYQAELPAITPSGDPVTSREDSPLPESPAPVAPTQPSFPRLFQVPPEGTFTELEPSPMTLDAPQQGRDLWAQKNLQVADASFAANDYASAAARYGIVAQQTSKGDGAWLAAMSGQLRSLYAAKSWVEARRIERQLENNPKFTSVLNECQEGFVTEREAAIVGLVQEGMADLRIAMQEADYEAAKDLADHVLALDSQQLDALLLLGAAGAAQNKVDEAFAAFIRAAYLFPHTCRPHWAMARLAEVRGDVRQARKHYLSYLETDCDDREEALATQAAQFTAQPEE